MMRIVCTLAIALVLSGCGDSDGRNTKARKPVPSRTEKVSWHMIGPMAFPGGKVGVFFSDRAAGSGSVYREVLIVEPEGRKSAGTLKIDCRTNEVEIARKPEGRDALLPLIRMAAPQGCGTGGARAVDLKAAIEQISAKDS